jgi:flagellar biosynthetic protein FliR
MPTRLLIALFLISVALGVLARTVPQMNVFIVGFPIQLAVGLSVLAASLPLIQVLLARSMRLLERDLLALVDFMG